MIWSDYIARAVFTEAEKLTQGRPYCIASHRRKVENLSQLSGVSLLRARFDIGPGSGFSFVHYSRFYTVLAVQAGNKEQYWIEDLAERAPNGLVERYNNRLRLDAVNLHEPA